MKQEKWNSLPDKNMLPESIPKAGKKPFYQDWNISRQRSGRYTDRSGKRTDILVLQNPRYRLTMLDRWLPHITASKFRSDVLKLWKVTGFFTKSSDERYFAYHHLQRKYLPINWMVLMTLRVTWGQRVQYYYWNRTIVRSKANFDAFRISIFII